MVVPPRGGELTHSFDRVSTRDRTGRRDAGRLPIGGGGRPIGSFGLSRRLSPGGYLAAPMASPSRSFVSTYRPRWGKTDRGNTPCGEPHEQKTRSNLLPLIRLSRRRKRRIDMSNPKETKHGKFTFYKKDGAALQQIRYLTGLLKVEDTSESSSAIQKISETQPELAVAFGAILAGVNAVSDAVTAAGTASMAGTSVASLFTSKDTKAWNTVEIEVVNNSSQVVALSSINPSYIDVVESIGAILPGQSGTIVCSKNPITGKSQINLEFLIGNNLAGKAERAPVDFVVKYNYNAGEDPGLWTLIFGADGEDMDQNLVIKTGIPCLQGIVFAANVKPEPQAPSFGVFTLPVETGTGMMQLMVTDGVN